MILSIAKHFEFLVKIYGMLLYSILYYWVHYYLLQILFYSLN